MDPFAQAAAALAAPASPQSSQVPAQQGDPFQAAAQQMGAGPSPSPSPVAGLPQETSGLANAVAGATAPLNTLANLGIRGLNAAGLVSDQKAQQAIGYNPIPSDQSRLSGQVGSLAGQMAIGVAAPAAAPFLFGAQGGEGAMEDIEALQKQGINPTTGQKLIDIAGQTALQFFVGKLAPGGTLNQAVLSKFAPEAANAIINAITRQAITAGIHLPEGMAQQLAANAITKASVNGKQDLSQGVVESGIANAAGAGIAQGIHDVVGGGMAHGAPQSDPFAEAAKAIAVPDQATLDSLKTAPPGTPGVSESPTPTTPEAPTPQTAPEQEAAPASTNRPLIDSAQPKYRVTDGGTSTGVPLNFEDPVDKALYLATVPRKGKIANEAVSFLQEQGFRPEDIERYGDELRDRIEGIAGKSAVEGHGLDVPAVGPEAETETPAERLPAPPAASNDATLNIHREASEPLSEAPPFPTKGEQRVMDSVNAKGDREIESANPPVATVDEAEHAEAASHLPAETNHNAVLAEHNPTARTVDPESLGTEHQEVLNDYKAITGKDMIPYAGGRGRGFHLNGDAYYNVERNNTPQLRREVIAHEATHYLQDTKPELVNQLDKALPPEMKQSLVKEYNQNYKAQEGKDLPAAQSTREAQAMAVGRAFARPSVARAVMEKNPGVFSRAADAVLGKLRGLTKGGRATNEIIGFLKSAKAEADQKAGSQAFTPEETTPAPTEKTTTPDQLPGAKTAKALVEEDVKPKLKELGDNFKNAWEGVKSLLSPQSRGEKGEGGVAARVMRERGGELARNTDRVNEAFDNTEKEVGKLTVDEQRAITDTAERGQKQANPALQPVADAIRQMYDDRLAQIQKIKPDFEGVANYMGHNYKDPKKATDTLLGLMRRPLEGTKGWQRQRYFPFQSDAIAAGLEPTTDNPVAMMRQKLSQMDKFIATHNAMNELKAQGLMKRVPARAVAEMKQKGYEQIDDKVGTIMAKPNRKGGVSIAGYWMAPEAVANVINNHLSPGIRSNDKFGGMYRTALAANHLKNSLQLVSGFHLAFATIDTMASKMALGFRQLRSGDVAGAAKSALSVASIVHPVAEAYANGRGVLKEWASPGSTKNSDYAKSAEMYQIAGGRAHMDAGEAGTSPTESMKVQYKKGNLVGAAVRAPLAGIEQLTKPIMDHIIPALKAGVFHDIAQHELDKLPANASRDDIRKVMGSAQDSVDDRLGEMVYDNTFWNRAVKDTAMATTRSVGWNLGTLRTFGGAAADAAKIPGQIMKGGLKNVQLTNRMAYSAAVPLTTALIGTLIHRAFTGKMPANLYDMLNPKTGRKNKDGDDERWAIPSYMKDLGEYGHDVHDAVKQANPALLGRTLSHKTSPLLSEALELMQNKDYYNTKIHNEDDPILKQLKDVGKYELGQDVPFSAKAVKKMSDEGQGARALLPLIGLNPARKDMIESPAALKAAELMQDKMPRGTRTTEQSDKSQMHTEVREQLQAVPKNQQNKILQPLVQTGQLTPDEAHSVQANARYGTSLERNVHHLDFESAMKVWDISTDDEKRKLVVMMLSKLRSAKDLTVSARKQYISTLLSERKRLGSATALPADDAGEEQ